MTEYDFSPGAVERYKAKQRSVQRWVHETERHNPPNPITIARQPPQRSLTFDATTRQRSSSTSRPSTSSRPKPRRSSTEHHHRSHSYQATRSHMMPAPMIHAMVQPYSNQPQMYYSPASGGMMVPSPVQQTYPQYVQYAPQAQPQKRGVFSRIMTFMGVNTNPNPVRSHSTHVTSRHSSRRKRRYSY